MVPLTSLWLPIVISSVIVFVASSLIHMFIGYHKNDYAQLPREAEIMDALRKFGIPPGDYIMPRPSTPGELKTPEYLDKVNKGPVAVLTVWQNGMVNMGQTMAMWFLYLVVVGVFAAYVASRALTPGAEYMEVFRFVGVTAFTGYSLALWQNSIWYKKKLSTTVKNTFDGLIYALLTAGTFGWLWPK